MSDIPTATPNYGITTTMADRRRTSAPRPLGMTTTNSVPSLIQSLDGLASNTLAAQQESDRVAKDILLTAEKTSKMLGSLVNRAETLTHMGVGGGGAPGPGGVSSVPPPPGGDIGSGLPLWSAWSFAGMTGLGGWGSSDYARPGASSGSSTVLGSPGAPSSQPPVPPLSSQWAPGQMPPWAAWSQAGGTGLPVTVPRPGAAAPPSGPPQPNRPIAGVPGVVSHMPGRGGGTNVEGAAAPSSDPAQVGLTPKRAETYTFGALRQDVAGSINRRISEWGSEKEQTLVDAIGNPIYVNGVVQKRAAPADAPDTALASVDPETGEVTPAQGFGRGYSAAMMAKNVAGGIQGGQSPLSVFSSAAPKLAKGAGIVTAGYMLVNQGLDFAEDQRAKNREYQSHLGGSNAEGFRERWNNQMFRLSMRGTMGGADADAIYKGALAEYGSDREMRDTYQGAAVDLYRGVGMGGQEIASALGLAAQSGNDNLYAFADAIKAVSATARLAGESAEDARAAFERTFKANNAFLTGTAQIDVSRAQAQITTAQGDRFGDVVDSTTQNRNAQLMAASSAGMTLSQYDAVLVSGGDEAALLTARTQDNAYRQAAEWILSPAALQHIRDTTRRAGGTSNMMQDEINRLAGEVMEMDGLASEQVVGMLAQVGIQANPNDAMPKLITQIGDEQYSAEAAVNAQVITKEDAAKRFTADTGPSFNRVAYSRLQAEGRTAIEGAGNSIERQRITREVRESEREWLIGQGVDEDVASKILRGETGRTGKQTAALGEMWERAGIPVLGGESRAKEFKDDFMTGRAVEVGDSERDSVIEAYLGRAQSGYDDPLIRKAIKRYDDLGGKSFLVTNAEGGKSAVNRRDLLTNFADQVQADPGSIEVVGGSYDGKSLADFLDQDTTDPSINPRKDQGKKGRGTPKEARERAKEGRVVIDLAPGSKSILETMFRFTPSGSAEMASSYGEIPPASHSVPPGQRNSQTGS